MVTLSRVPLSRVTLARARSPGVTWEKNLLTWPGSSCQLEKTPWTLRVKHIFFPFFLLIFTFFPFFLFSLFSPMDGFASWELTEGPSSHSFDFSPFQ